MKLTKEQKDRVAIARDALEWEQAGALQASTQQYVLPLEPDDRYYGHDLNIQARDIKIGKCRVCALGALLLAKAVRFDKVTVGDIRNRNVHRLTDHFSAKQINEIEAAFEGTSYPWTNGTGIGNSVDDFRWREFFPKDKDRFRAILQNIIRNNGTFDIKDIR